MTKAEALNRISSYQAAFNLLVEEIEYRQASGLPEEREEIPTLIEQAANLHESITYYQSNLWCF